MTAVIFTLAAVISLCCVIMVSRGRARRAAREWDGDLEADTYIRDLTEVMPVYPDTRVPAPVRPLTVPILTGTVVGKRPLYTPHDTSFLDDVAYDGIEAVRGCYDGMQEMFASWGWEDLPSFSESSTRALPRG